MQWRIQRGPRGHVPPPKLMKKSCDRLIVAVIVTQCLTLAVIKSVAYSLPGKIMFSASFCSNSSAFDRATVSLEYLGRRTGDLNWTWTYYSAEATLRWARECTKIRISRPKNEFFSPSTDLTPIHSRRRSLRLRRPTWPSPNPNPGSVPTLMCSWNRAPID